MGPLSLGLNYFYGQISNQDNSCEIPSRSSNGSLDVKLHIGGHLMKSALATVNCHSV